MYMYNYVYIIMYVYTVDINKKSPSIQYIDYSFSFIITLQ